MPIRTAVNRGQSQTKPARPASGFAAPPWRRGAGPPGAVPSSGGRLAPVFSSREREAQTVREAAHSGLRTPGVELPFAAQIRQAFPAYDLRGVEAHVGPAATASAEAAGAEAYAAGEHVVFSGRPDLYTVAHEVAHVVQQRAGARPEGGIGRPGDVHERTADAAAREVVAGRPATGLPPPLPPARGAGPAAVQRKIRSLKTTSGTTYYSTEDPLQTQYPTRAQAQAREAELVADQLKNARVSARKNKFTGSTAAQQTAARHGVSKSPDVEYPPRPAEELASVYPAVAPLQSAYVRSAMGPPMRESLLASAREKKSVARTEQDKAMLVAPSQNMVEAKISMNHKLADSSVAALMQSLWVTIQLRDGKLDRSEKKAIQEFMLAMADRSEAAAAYKALVRAADEDQASKAAVYLQPGIDLLSMSVKNLRFGDADINTLILYAFDPNQDSSGTDTPLTDRIRSAVKGLATAGLVPKPVAKAAITQARRKSTDEAMSSSSV